MASMRASSMLVSRFGGVLVFFSVLKSPRRSFCRAVALAKSPLWSTFGVCPAECRVAVLVLSLSTRVLVDTVVHCPCKSFLFLAFLAFLLASWYVYWRSAGCVL